MEATWCASLTRFVTSASELALYASGWSAWGWTGRRRRGGACSRGVLALTQLAIEARLGPDVVDALLFPVRARTWRKDGAR